MRIAVLGIGNLLTADDGVGIRAVREFGASVTDMRVACSECERGGLDLLDHLAGFDRAIIIDASNTGSHPCGAVFEFTLRKPFALDISPSLHTIGFGSVLAFGEVAGMKLPEEVTVYCIEAADIETFGADCTPIVEAAIPIVVTRLKNKISELVPDIHFTSSVSTEAVF